jgi:hypothetical protein
MGGPDCSAPAHRSSAVLPFRPHDHEPAGFGGNRRLHSRGVFLNPNSSPPTVTRRIIAAEREPGSWLTHGRTYGEQRFSPLTKVSTQTVGRLGLAWTYEMRINRGAQGHPAGGRRRDVRHLRLEPRERTRCGHGSRAMGAACVVPGWKPGVASTATSASTSTDARHGIARRRASARTA